MESIFGSFLLPSGKEEAMNKLELIRLSDVQPQEVNWLWYPYIPFGKVSIVQGDPGEGKTMLLLNVIADLTKGRSLWEQEEPNAPMTCIYQTAEDGIADTIVPRLSAMDADLEKVIVINEENALLSITDDRIEQAIVQTGAKLLVLDPLQAYLGTDIDMHRANEVRPAFHALANIAQRTGCAIVLVGHMNKMKGLGSVYRGLGSIDIAGAARSIMLVCQPDKSRDNVFFAHVKSNLTPKGQTLMFVRDDDRLTYQGPCDDTADEILNGGSGEEKETISKLGQAMLFLQGLAQERDEIASTDVYSLMREKGISKRTAEQAKQSLGIESVRHGNQCYFDLRSLQIEDPAV